jgi:hypothetical protein
LYFNVPPYLLPEGAAGGLLTGGGAVGTAGVEGTAGVVDALVTGDEDCAGAELVAGAGAGVCVQALNRKDAIRTTIARVSNHFLT